MSNQEKPEQDRRVDQLEHRLSEACDALWDDYVDPREAFRGDNDDFWSPIFLGSGAKGNGVTFPQLNDLRDACRRLALTNEYAINGHENRISYIVGSGHVYHATIRKGIEAPVELARETQHVLDDFQSENRWHARQQEIVRRLDRDGEVFIRLFVDHKGMTRVRFVEPEQVATPQGNSIGSRASHGILTDDRDVEEVIGYYIDGALIDATEIQHRKANVDSNVKRGLPLFTPVRKNLRRAEKLLRNMSVVAEIQSAIALIRKHRSASRSGIEQFVAEKSSSATVDTNGRTRWLTEYGPGTILDAPAGLDYDFPATGIDAGSYVTILQAELRAIAARLVMPEFMFTSDASNANYASTMVAEGPAVKMFERQQAAMIEDDLAIMHRVIDNAIAVGRLPTQARSVVDVQVSPPSLEVRNPLQSAKVNQIAYEHGALSLQTWCQRLGLDYDQEQKNRRLHQETVVDKT